MAEIQVAVVSGGLCPECGQGLWGGPPCEHKAALNDREDEGSASCDPKDGEPHA